MNIPTELRYLESESSLKERMHALTKRQPSATQAAYVAACITHGRLYWESAEVASLETRPLLLYYGAASFAKAVIMAKTACQISEIANGHGMSCTPGPGETIATYRARANGKGLFQQFNDVVAKLNRVHYFHEYNSRYHYTASAESTALLKLEVNIQQILSRVPDISTTFALCIGNPSSLLAIQFDSPHGPEKPYEVRVDLPERFEGIEGLKAHVQNIRRRAPFLNEWRVGHAEHAWNNSIVQFYNRAGALQPQEFDSLQESDAGKSFTAPASAISEAQSFDPFAGLPPLTGGYGGNVAYLEDIGGESLSEYSIFLLGLLTLSSLVRYQPHVWTSSIHRRRFGDRPIDDKLLPAIEAFLSRSTEAFPRLVTDILLER